jgi:hypothetical protein
MTELEQNVIARAIKRQWLATVAVHGKGEHSLQVHNTAARIAYALASYDATFNQTKFLRKCGIES